MRDAPIVGTDAPDFVLHAEGGRVITTLRARRPRVLAFVRGWSIARARDAELRAIRAELRGLGADLTILSDAAVWSFRPDDDVELCAGGTTHLTRELAAAARAWGVDGDRDAVFVVDHDGLIRFAHVSDVPLALALGEALATASAAVHAKPRPASFTRREWTLTCLIAGLTVSVLPA